VEGGAQRAISRSFRNERGTKRRETGSTPGKAKTRKKPERSIRKAAGKSKWQTSEDPKKTTGLSVNKPYYKK